MWVKVAFFVCVRRAIFRGTRVVVGREFGMGWEAFVCRHYLELLNQELLEGLNRWIGLAEGSCGHERRQRSCEELLESHRMISDPLSLVPSFLYWVGALRCLQLSLWSSCWKKMCVVEFLFKVITGLMASVPDSLWVSSSEVGS